MSVGWRCDRCEGEVARVRRSHRCACGGELRSTSAREFVSTNVGELVVGATLHHGAYAEVLAGTLDGTDVALKRVRADRRGHPAADARIAAEIDTLRTIRAPDLVRAMAFLSGGDGVVLPRYRTTLEEGTPHQIDRLGGLDVIASALSRALAALHAAGVLHRDVHGRNVLIEPFEAAEDATVLADLGHRHREGRVPVTAPDCVAARPGYAAPELFVAGSGASEASDVYALAVTLHQVAVGRRPHEHTDPEEECHRAQREDALPLRCRQLRVAVTTEHAKWIDAALSRAPEQRPSLAGLAISSRGPFATEGSSHELR